MSKISVYGVSRVLEMENALNKYIWIVLIIVSSGFGMYMIAQNVEEFWAYDVVTKTRIVEQGQNVFPAITFCPYVYSDDTLEIQEATLDNQVIPVNAYEHSPSSGCYRYNAYHENSTDALLNVTYVGIYRGLKFQIKVIDPLNIYISDNYLNSFEKTVQFLTDSKSTYVSLYQTKETKLGYPYNNCSYTEEKYRQLNCKQECIYRQVADKYNCTYVGFRYFLNNSNLGLNLCNFTRGSRTTRHALREFTNEKLSEFGAECEAGCEKECTSIKYDNIMMTMEKSDVSSQVNQTTDLKVIYIYFEQLSYHEITQFEKITLFNLISSIGGSLSLFIGVKFLSMMEVFELFIDVFIVLFRYKQSTTTGGSLWLIDDYIITKKYYLKTSFFFIKIISTALGT